MSLHGAGPAGHPILEVAEDLLISIRSPFFAHLPIVLGASAALRVPSLERSRRLQCWSSNPWRATVPLVMTAKEKLRATVEELSETEAADTLEYIATRRQSDRDALGELLEHAPLDDEPTTPAEEKGLREAREQIARGDVISAEEIRREFA
jgi:hypothetical protein